MQQIIQALISLLPALVAVLPFAAFAVSYWRQKPTYSAAKNASIASSTILGAAVVAALLQGKLTGNMTTDAGIVLAVATALQSEVFMPIQRFLRGTDATPTGLTPPPPPDPQPITFPPSTGKGA